MPTWRASAAGKVVLMGDYVVLEGAPALAAAVPQAALATYTVAGAKTYRIEAPTLAASFECALTDEASRQAALAAAPPGLALVLRALLAVHRDSRGQLPAGLLHVDTSAFFAHGHKLGLGSSAAALVAAARVLASALATTGAAFSAPRFASLPALIALHQQWQGGRGSGIDVAVSHLGGVVRFALGDRARGPLPMHADDDFCGLPAGDAGNGGDIAAACEPELAGGRLEGSPTAGADTAGEPVVTAQNLPVDTGPQWAVIAVGGQSDTSQALAALAEFKRRDPTTYWRLFEQLAHLSHAACEFWLLGAQVAFLPLVTEARRVLGELGGAMGWPIVTPQHAEVAAAIAALGGAYKPSGAGGKDVGVAFFATPIALSRLRRTLKASGAAVVAFGGQAP